MSRILIIDDEPQIRRFLRIGLTAQHYEVSEAESGNRGLELAALQAPHLVVLDLGLPDKDGQQVLRELREFYAGPVIILSVRNSEKEKVEALDSGANDYVVKPFGIQELLARIRVLLRDHAGGEALPQVFDDGHLHVDLVQRQVSVGGERVRLSKKEFALLRMLLLARGRVVTQRQILEEVWGKSHVEDTHYLRIFIGKLRAHLQDDPGSPRYLETEPGVGYRFIGGE